MNMANLVMILASGGSAGGWKIGSFLNAAQQTLANYGSILTSLIGVAMVIVGIYQLAKGLISHGKGQHSWIVTIALILVGGALAVSGGWKMVGQFARGGRNSLSDMAQGNADSAALDQSDPFNK